MHSDRLINRVFRLAARECSRLKSNPVYLLCMVVFPLLVTIFFTSLMDEGQPKELPVGIVDLDNTSTTRKLTRTLDAFSGTRVQGHYKDFNAARRAMQQNEIYGFMLFPQGTTDKLLSARRPEISFYYSNTSLTAGSLVFRDLKTISMLGSASVGSATMSAKGYTGEQISTFLQPVTLDFHAVNNPWVNYNIYLSTTLIPGCLFLFIFLITAYSVGSELKQGTARKWLATAGGNIMTAILGKLLPQFVIHLIIIYAYMLYVFGVLGFPHPGGILPMALLGLLSVLSAQGLGLFFFGIFPSMRMSMSVCSLLAVLGFSLAGTAFPTFAMDPQLKLLSAIFPLRHFFMIYQISIFNGMPMADVWQNIVALIIFAALPVFVLPRLNKAISEYVYIP